MGRLTVGLAVGAVAGWLWSPVVPETTEYRVVTRIETMLVEPDDEPTPYADSLVDWDRVDAETDCLWEFLQVHGIELTLSNVLTAGDWADMHGGACAMMEGEDDE